MVFVMYLFLRLQCQQLPSNISLKTNKVPTFLTQLFVYNRYSKLVTLNLTVTVQTEYRNKSIG